MADMLQYVQLNPNDLMTLFRDQVKQQQDIDEQVRDLFGVKFESGLYGYTYLEG